MALVLKRNDRRPSLSATLKDSAGVVDLTLASTVKFFMAASVGAALKVNGTCSIVSATEGTVRYDWGATDLDTAGTYVGEFEVTFQDGKKATFPNSGQLTIVISPDLG